MANRCTTVVNSLGPVAAISVLSLPKLKQHCHVYHDDDDALIDDYGQAAVEYVERLVGSAIVPANYQLSMSAWPTSDVSLKPWPVQSLTSVEYYPESSPETLTAYDGFELMARDDGPGELQLKPGETPPALASLLFPVVVKWTAGYTTLPRTLTQALQILVKHWYDTRDAVTVGTTSKRIDRSLDSLLRLHRVNWAEAI